MQDKSDGPNFDGLQQQKYNSKRNRRSQNNSEDLILDKSNL